MKKYKITTFGCQMNENDSEKLSGIIENLGYKKEIDDLSCDLIVINTCSVRENANNKFFGHLGKLKNLKGKNPNLVVAVCGCMMQEEHIVKEIKGKYPFVDIVFGTHNIHIFEKLLSEAMESKKTVIEVWSDSDTIFEDTPIKREYKYKALVSIMNGCDNFCSYCIVPYTRGREKSRDPKNIIEEIKGLARDGVKEVTLLGQNVNSYGKGLEKEISFAKLLKLVSEVKGIEKIRFMTSHPKDISEELIYEIRDNHKICSHVHLPVQSGSSRILELMNRKYTKEHYISLVEKIRREIKGVSITTDIIVGFPGESEEDFRQTLEVYEKCQFDSAFTYLYSKRENTKASLMEENASKEEVKNRFDRLIDLHNEISLKQNEKYIGKVIEVLVEGVSKNNENRLSGRSDTFKLVQFSGTSKVGQIVRVKITSVKTFHLEGIEVI